MSKGCGLLMVLLAVPLVLTVGCGSNSGRVAVRGTVTLNGTPVEDGNIIFVPLEGEDSKHVRAGGHIHQGKYTFSGDRGLTPGKFRVQIRWPKKTGRQVPLPDDPANVMDETKEVVPPKYNTESQLTADIPGSDPLDFELKTE